MEERARRTLDLFRIAYLRDRVTYDLSGGEKQKVAIASIDIIGTDAMVFDNPTSQLDPLGRKMVHEAVRKLAEEGRTIVMVDDSLDELVAYADRIILIDDGRVEMDVTPQEFCLRRDKVHEVGLMLPQIAELAHELATDEVTVDEIPFSVDEGIAFVRKLVEGNERKNQEE
jgi:energy-coupling factor transport system ATP-binding protein